MCASFRTRTSTRRLRKVERHQLDLLIDLGPPARYWVNPTAPKGYFVEFALLQSASTASRDVIKEQMTGGRCGIRTGYCRESSA